MAKDINSIFFNITPEIEELALKCEKNNAIEKELYTKYEVKRGLRDLNGKGVLAGLTNYFGCMCIKDRGWYIRSMRRKPVL